MLLVLAATAAMAVDFEQPPEEAAAASLPAELATGPNFHVREPVAADGLMHHYVVDSRFGVFPAYGQEALKIRVKEVAALTQISTTDVDVVANTVKRRAQTDAKTLRQVATNPLGTVVGIPKGIGHLFNGAKAQAEQFLERNKPQGGRTRASLCREAIDG